MKSILPALAFVACASTAVCAQQAAEVSKTDHAKMNHEMAADMPSTKAFKKSMRIMMNGMDEHYTGNADIDFVKGMIPHHQGAIDMAKIMLEYGKDDEIRKLATEIIKAQQQEIAQMQAWLKLHEQQNLTPVDRP